MSRLTFPAALVQRLRFLGKKRGLSATAFAIVILTRAVNLEFDALGAS